jgi:23S rRNA pseudouridine2605 synthase
MSNRTPVMLKEKLQKVLARAGLGSRRAIEQWIQAGRIKINHQLAVLGDRVTVTDRITLDGRWVRLANVNTKPKVLLYHKPAGQICTRQDPQNRPTIFDSLPRLRGKRWVAVGRLDFNTSGLLLLTTDGELANRLMHPAFEIEREYAVRIVGQLNEAMMKHLLQGVLLEDGIAKVESIRDAGGTGLNHWYHVILKEGKNREVRRLFASQNVKVSRLIRVRFGPIQLPRFLRPGCSMEMKHEDIALLFEAAGLKYQEE